MLWDCTAFHRNILIPWVPSSPFAVLRACGCIPPFGRGLKGHRHRAIEDLERLMNSYRYGEQLCEGLLERSDIFVSFGYFSTNRAFQWASGHRCRD